MKKTTFTTCLEDDIHRNAALRICAFQRHSSLQQQTAHILVYSATIYIIFERISLIPNYLELLK